MNKHHHSNDNSFDINLETYWIKMFVGARFVYYFDISYTDRIEIFEIIPATEKVSNFLPENFHVGTKTTNQPKGMGKLSCIRTSMHKYGVL